MGRIAQAQVADEFATNLMPVVQAIQNAGAATLSEIASALNARGVRSARGNNWHRSSVRNLLARIE
jgi:recombinase-like protein